MHDVINPAPRVRRERGPGPGEDGGQHDMRQEPSDAGARPAGAGDAGQLRAGVARVDITSADTGIVNDPLYVKALVLSDGATTAVIATVDAVAIAEIGTIGNDYLGNVRSRLGAELGIAPARVLITASHCPGRVCAAVEERTVRAVLDAWRGMVPVVVGTGVGHEDRIMENRRLTLNNGREADVRHAYGQILAIDAR